jgi:hypothetical protein
MMAGGWGRAEPLLPQDDKGSGRFFAATFAATSFEPHFYEVSYVK